MKYKVGDKLLCKKKLKHFLNSGQEYHCEENQQYIIDWVGNGGILIGVANLFQLDISRMVRVSVVSEYFYTQQEIRRKKLNEITSR